MGAEGVFVSVRPRFFRLEDIISWKSPTYKIYCCRSFFGWEMEKCGIEKKNETTKATWLRGTVNQPWVVSIFQIPQKSHGSLYYEACSVETFWWRIDPIPWKLGSNVWSIKILSQQNFIHGGQNYNFFSSHKNNNGFNYCRTQLAGTFWAKIVTEKIVTK